MKMQIIEKFELFFAAAADIPFFSGITTVELFTDVWKVCVIVPFILDTWAEVLDIHVRLKCLTR